MQRRRLELEADRAVDGTAARGSDRSRSSAARRRIRRPRSGISAAEMTVGCRNVRVPSATMRIGCAAAQQERGRADRAGGEDVVPGADGDARGRSVARRARPAPTHSQRCRPGPARSTQPVDARVGRAAARRARAPPESSSPASTAWRWSGSPCRSSRGSSSRCTLRRMAAGGDAELRRAAAQELVVLVRRHRPRRDRRARSSMRSNHGASAVGGELAPGRSVRRQYASVGSGVRKLDVQLTVVEPPTQRPCRMVIALSSVLRAADSW